MMSAEDLNSTSRHPSQDDGDVFLPAPELPRLKIPDHLKDAEFLSTKAGSFTKVPQRTVQLWSEAGWLIPEGRDTTGTGKRRLYSVINCIEIGVLKALVRKRLGDQAIRDTMQFVRTFRDRFLSGMAAFLHLYVNYDNPDDMGRMFSLYHKPELPANHPGVSLNADYLNRYDEVMTINVGKIVRKVLAAIE